MIIENLNPYEYYMRPINLCFNKQIIDICQRAAELEALNIRVKTYLPENLREFCSVGSFEKGCLILTTPDAVWATQLRYALPNLRDLLRKEAGLYQLSAIKVIVL
jgi:hypothetical protein